MKPGTRNCILAALSFVIGVHSVYSQSRAFLSTGFTQSFGGNVATLLAKSPAQLLVELEVDKKVMGSLYVVTGLSSYGVGYSSSESFFGESNSDYNARFLS